MKVVPSDYDPAPTAHARLRMLQHSEQVTETVSGTCRLCRLSPTQGSL